MNLVLGTYERFLLGYKLPDELQEGCQLQRSFTHAAHQGPVRCLDAAGPYVVSGGQDDQLHIYDVKRNHDLGFMMNPGDGAIPCLKFFTPAGSQNPTHLFSGSDDGSIAVWKAGGGWEHLKLMRGHKGPVRSLSIHPSGLLALSVGHDKALRMWNLAKGRCSYTAKLEAEADYIGFSADGESYALLCDKLVSIHSVGEEGSVIAQLQHQRRAVSLLQQQDGAAVITGLDDGRLCYWDLRAAQQPVWEYEKAHNTRIRSIVALTQGADGVSGLPHHFATAASDGVVKVWDSRSLSNSSSSSGDRLQHLASVSTGGRITGMVLSEPDKAAAAAIGTGGAATAAVGHQGGGKHKQKVKKKHKQQQQQQQDLEQAATRDPDVSRQQAAQSKQQRDLVQAGSKGSPHGAKQQQQQQQQGSQQKKQKQNKKEQKVSADDSALVPRVQTKIIKKKRVDKQQMQKAIAAAVGGSKSGKATKQQGMLKHKKQKMKQ